MLKAVDAGDAAGVADIVIAAKGKLVLNADRVAVQQLGCNGTVVAHIPVSTALFAAVRANPKIERRMMLAAVAGRFRNLVGRP